MKTSPGHRRPQLRGHRPFARAARSRPGPWRHQRPGDDRPSAGRRARLVARITARLLAGDGDLLPVSAPRSTAPSRPGRRSTRSEGCPVTLLDVPLSVDCGKCAMVCPHATIRIEVLPSSALEAAPADSCARSSGRGGPIIGSTDPGRPRRLTALRRLRRRASAKSKTDSSHKSINVSPVADHRDIERAMELSSRIPLLDPTSSRTTR